MKAAIAPRSQSAIANLAALNIQLFNWPKHPNSVVLALLTKGLGIAVEPISDGPLYLVEYEDFPTIVVNRFDAAVAKGKASNTAEGFREFASKDFATYHTFLSQWGERGNDRLIIPLAPLRSNPRAFLPAIFKALAPNATAELLYDQADVHDSVRARVENWFSRRPKIDWTEFRYYNATLFAELAQLKLPHEVVQRVFRDVMGRDPDAWNMLTLQTEPSRESLCQRLMKTEEFRNRPGGPSDGKHPAKSEIMETTVSKAEIALAYQLFLGRNPSERELDRYTERAINLLQLRRGFIASEEFVKVYKRLGPAPTNPTPATLIHLHVPKTAGTSLNHILDANFDKAGVLDLREETMNLLQSMPTDKRRHLRVIKGHLLHGVAKLLPQPSIYLCLLRRPGPRIYSFYKYIRRQPLHPLHQEINADHISFGGFLSLAAERPGVRNEVDNGQIRRIADQFDATSFGNERAIFQQALVNIFAPDMIYGLTDHFGGFLDRLREQGLIPTSSPVRINVSPQQDDLEIALSNLNSAERGLYGEFTKWDDWFYSICEDAYSSHSSIRERLS